MKILIMGLPGSGKTWLAERLQKHLNCAWYNADKIREMSNDWDFSIDGRHRQSNRMRSLADFEKSYGKTVICDFVCPTNSTRKVFNPDITIWLDTIKTSKFEDTNKLFENPINADYHFTHQLSDKDVKSVAELINNV
jgi:adenylylsulfate kinase